MAARATGLRGCWGHCRGSTRPHSPSRGGTGWKVSLLQAGTPSLGGFIQACSGRGPRAGAAPAGHGRQREHHLNEALRHCCRCPRDVTAEILLVSRFGPPSLAACEEEALLAWPLPGSPPPMLGSLPEPCRLHLPAPYGAGAAGRTRLRCNAQSTRKSQISHPRGRCGNNGHEKSGLTERVGVVGAGTPLWLLG